MMVAAEWGTGQVFWTMLWFFLWVIWFWLLIVVFGDIFRSKDLGGGAKALWTIFVILVPYLGVFVYLIARGHSMADRSQAAAQAQNEAFQQYVREAASTSTTSTSTTADELTKLASLQASGAITDDEYQQLKAKALA